MKELSNRSANFTDSVIRRMTRVANKYGAVNLSQGFPDFDPPKAITDRLARVACEGPHQYALTWGAKNFRDAVAKKYEHFSGVKIDPETEIVEMCIRDRGESLVNTDGDNARIFRSAEELFETGESCYDAVIIATPHKTHKELALKAFAKGKAVLCDKPAAADIGEALAMQKAASESGRIYGMIFHQRLYPKYIRIKQMIDNGELGDIKRVCLINSRYLRTSYYHKSGSWRSSFAGEGGGALINQGQHILDMYQYLFGMPQKLFAAIPFGKYNDFIVDDEATIVMEYDNGKTGTFIPVSYTHLIPLEILERSGM